MLKMYHEKVDAAQQPPAFKELVAKTKMILPYGRPDFWQEYFVSAASINILLNKPKAPKPSRKTRPCNLAVSLLVNNGLSEKTTEAYSDLKKGNRILRPV